MTDKLRQKVRWKRKGTNKTIKKDGEENKHAKKVGGMVERSDEKQIGLKEWFKYENFFLFPD